MKRIDKISVSRRRIYGKRKKPDIPTENLGEDVGSKTVDYWRWEKSKGQRKGGERDREKKK